MSGCFSSLCSDEEGKVKIMIWKGGFTLGFDTQSSWWRAVSS